MPETVIDTKRALRKLWWQEAQLSLWTPVTVFGVALLIYIAIVEFDTPAYAALAPVLKVFGLAMLGWLAGIAGYSAQKPIRTRIKLRRDARELVRELTPLLKKRGHKLDEKARTRIADQLAALDDARISGNTDKLQHELTRTHELATKHLAAWRRNPTLHLVIGIAKALAIALAIRAVLIEPYKIPSSSMIPTLQIGDQIFVNKFIYGVRIPWANVVPFQIVRAPRRGDVIVFESPTESSKDLIKRVVGIPGDHLEINGDQITINGVVQPIEPDRAEPEVTVHDQDLQTTQWSEETADQLYETLDGHRHHILHMPARHNDFGTIVADVPKDSVFVMGDNRDNSLDARFGFRQTAPGEKPTPGYVPYGNIKGKAMVIWLALGWDGIGSSLFGGTGLRTDRLFLPVR